MEKKKKGKKKKGKRTSASIPSTSHVDHGILGERKRSPIDKKRGGKKGGRKERAWRCCLAGSEKKKKRLVVVGKFERGNAFCLLGEKWARPELRKGKKRGKRRGFRPSADGSLAMSCGTTKRGCREKERKKREGGVPNPRLLGNTG